MESDDAWTVLSLLPLHSKTLALIDNLEGHFEEIFAPTTPFQMLYALNICIGTASLYGRCERSLSHALIYSEGRPANVRRILGFKLRRTYAG